MNLNGINVDKLYKILFRFLNPANFNVIFAHSSLVIATFQHRSV